MVPHMQRREIVPARTPVHVYERDCRDCITMTAEDITRKVDQMKICRKLVSFLVIHFRILSFVILTTVFGF